MEQIMNYVKPELLIVAVVLYFIGMGIKKIRSHTGQIYPGNPWCFRHSDLWNLCYCYMRYIWRAGNRNGNFYRNHTGNPRCRT